jgi:hypothetical protein
VADQRFAAAQKGVSLAEAMPYRNAAEAQEARKSGRARRRRAGAGAKKATRSGPAAAGGTATTPALPAPAALSTAERLRLLDAFETVIGGVYTHLPLKRARYGFDPVQRLRILRTEVGAFDNNAFHVELAAIVTQMRDYHTRYTWPAAFAGKVAVLPFLVEMYGPDAAPTYVVTKVGKGLDAGFVPGVLLQQWNGVPIDRAVVRHADEECAGRPDGLRSASLQSLTFRSMEYGPPPDEEWVVVGYRKSDAAGAPTGALKEARVPWKVVDPGAASGLFAGGPTGERKRLRRTRAVNPAAAAVRMAKMLLFAPEALVGETPPAAAPVVSSRSRGLRLVASTIATTMPETLKVQTLQVPGGSPVAYLRIWAFETDPDKFIAELLRVIPLLPQDGLIIDVRGNPGGYILAAEQALQLFTPKPIEPVRFSVLATTFTRDLAALPAMSDELAPWKESLDAAVRNGELYSQPVPISDPADCNAIGQQYGGPVLLVGDTNTYSAGDLFSAGFVDNDLGPFLCVGLATGAGGANVWEYGELRKALVGTPMALPALTSGIGLSFAFRRATRAGPSEGLTIEDVGVAGTPYAMTRNDLLAGNGDLLVRCVALLRKQPLSAMGCAVDRANRKVSFATRGLDRVDAFVDGHPVGSFGVADGGSVEVPFAATAKRVDAAGFKGDALLQRRRVVVKA